MVNKKAQDLSIGTLILIVLGIVVLVLLILGFTLGWDNLIQKINIFGGTSSVGDIVTACKLATTSQDTFTLCQKEWTVDVEGKDMVISCRSDEVRGSLDNDLRSECARVDEGLERCFEKYRETPTMEAGVLQQNPDIGCNTDEITHAAGFREASQNSLCCIKPKQN